MSAPGERLASKVRVRLLEPEDSLAHLTALLHRAYKQHADRGLKALAAFQPEEVTRRRIADGDCFVALYLNKVVGTIMFKSPEQTARAWPGVPWFDPASLGAGLGWDEGGEPLPAPPPARERGVGGVSSFSQFAVEPEFQGKGIGGELMRHVEQRAAAMRASHIALSTPEPAEWLVQMYLRHGYAIVARWQWNETNYTSAIMSKRVAE